jgi:CHAT domain-containing protein/tetratricopeptide (TPR) repeat protein
MSLMRRCTRVVLVSLVVGMAGPSLMTSPLGQTHSSELSEVPPSGRELNGDALARDVKPEQQAAGQRACAGGSGEAVEPACDDAEIGIRRQGADRWQIADARRTLQEALRIAKLPEEGQHDLVLARDLAKKALDLTRPEEALPLWASVVEKYEKWLGHGNRYVGDALVQRARSLTALCRYSAAEPLLREGLAIRRKALGDDHPDVGDVYYELENVLLRLGRHADAESVLRELLSVYQRSLDEDDPRTAECCHHLANILCYIQGRYAESERLYRWELTIRLRALGEDDLDTAKTYSSLADSLSSQARNAAAEPFLRRALSIRLKSLGESHAQTIDNIDRLAINLVWQGRHAEAAPLFREALLGMHHKGAELDSPNTLRIYNDLVNVLIHVGNYAEAEPVLRELLGIRQKVFGENDPRTADTFRDLANLVFFQGRYAEAESVYRRALTIRLKAAGENAPVTARAYQDLAKNLIALGKYAEAEPLLRKALAVNQKALGEDHPQTAESRYGYANILLQQRRLAEAEAIYRKELAHRLRAFGEDRLEIASCYDDLANTLTEQGEYTEAEALLRRALAIRLKMLGVGHDMTDHTLMSLAYCLERQGEFAEAEAIYHRALEIWRKTLGENHPKTSAGYVCVASVVLYQGRHAEAEGLLRKALAGCRKSLGDDHPNTCGCYHNLAAALEARGELGEAEHLWRKVLNVRTKTLGRDNALTGSTFNHLAFNLDAQGRLAEAIENWTAAAEISERMNRLRGGSGLARSLRSPFSDLPALAVALARQGSAGDAWVRWEAHLARGLLDDLSARQFRLLTSDQRGREKELNRRLQWIDECIAPIAAKAHRTQGESAQLDTLRRRQNELRSEWIEFQNALDREYRASVGKPSTLEQVQKAIPARTALVGWLDVGKHHWACVVRSQGEPIWIPTPVRNRLEISTKESDDHPVRLRAALAGDLPEWRELAETLACERILPLSPHMKGVNHWIILPSKGLMGVPIEALVAALPEGSPRPVISYSPSGSMLARSSALRSQLPGPSRLLAVGDPAVLRRDGSDLMRPPASDGITNKAVSRGIDASRSIRSQHMATGTPDPDVRDESLIRLPGTRREVEAIAALFPHGQATTLMGLDATESNLQRLAESGGLKSFRFVHLATHGKSNATAALRSALFLTPEPDAQTPSPDPATRDAAADGQITAEQIVRTWELDADIVVLSACQSGLGREAGGEGYLGFAQAFFLQGARSLVLSQWRVDDRATELLMTRFYQNLLGERHGLPNPLPKAKALDEAKEWLRGLSIAEAGTDLGRIERGVPRSKQGEPVSGRPFEHPYYWAAFILIGDPN